MIEGDHHGGYEQAGWTALLAGIIRGPAQAVARRRVFRQLLASLLYEGALTARAVDGNRWAVDGTDVHGLPVRYTFELTHRHSFGRISLGGAELLRETVTGCGEAESVATFLHEVRADLHADPECLASFTTELEHTVCNDALSLHERTRRAVRLADATYDSLESAVTDGHLYHPVYKSRIGFDPVDNMRYGPEFAQPIHPLWIAAHTSITRVATSARRSAGLPVDEQPTPEAITAFHGLLAASGVRAADYLMLPVHPWQWREHLAYAFAPWLSAGDLVVLGADPHEHRAQQSIRTLACHERPSRSYVKLSMSIINTSTSRVLAPHTVGNAPAISDWLGDIARSDPFLRDRLRTILLGEQRGVAVDPGGPEGAGAHRYGAMACIWRESLHNHLTVGERAAPFTALTSTELDGTPAIDPWIREYGLRDWLRGLLSVSVPPIVHLLRCHGIALEAHAQNMILVHRGGLPVRVALRDFHDGVRFCRAALTEPWRCPSLDAPPEHHVNRNSFVETERVDQVTDFVLDAFLFVNLSELAMFLRDAYGLAEREFWAMTRQIVLAHHREFPRAGARFDVFAPAVDVEQLAVRRLLPDTEPRTHPVPNPLATGH